LFRFFFQAEDGIRDFHVTGVQTCALPICALNKKGVAAFVLKYRLNQTPADLEGFAESIRQMLSGPRPPRDPGAFDAAKMLAPQRSEERRVGKECRSGGPQQTQEDRGSRQA